VTAIAVLRSLGAVLAAATLACSGATTSGATDAGQGVAVDVQPPAAAISPSGSVAFTAAVTGTAVLSVTWTVEPEGCGTVTQGGIFTAPDAPAICRVRARSAANASVSDAATVTVTTSPPSGATVVNHANADAGVIPLSYLDTVRGWDILFQHKSVGNDLTNGLLALGGSLNGVPAGRYGLWVAGWPYWWSDEQGGHDGTPPAPSWFATHDGVANREDGSNGNASSKTTAFNANLRTAGYGAVVDVALMKFCFTETYDLTGQQTWDLYRTVMEALIADFPGVKFVWTTMPLAFVGTQSDPNGYGLTAYTFNNLLREYVATNGGYLLDIADIEAHAANGALSVNAQGRPTVALDWALTAGDAHMNAAGATRLANAWWTMMARVAGWNP
jgi:hypothetical protein